MKALGEESMKYIRQIGNYISCKFLRSKKAHNVLESKEYTMQHKENNQGGGIFIYRVISLLLKVLYFLFHSTFFSMLAF